MKEIAYRCDVCGATRGEGNHWFQMNDSFAEDSSPLFFPWSTQDVDHRGHICSAACAHAALDKWLTEMQKRSHGDPA